MNRFSGKYWLQNRPLAVQLWAVLSLLGTLAMAAGLVYMALVVFPGAELTGVQLKHLGYLFLMVITANLFVAKVVTQRITEPFERLGENLTRVKKKNWSEKIHQVSRKDEVGQIINTLSQIQRNVLEINEDEEFFYQSVSHGLKTPIMVIQNCCAAYHDGIYGDEALDIIMGESVVLESGIRRLLYAASLEHMLGKQSDFCPVNLNELAQDCQRRFLGNEKGIRIGVELPPDCAALGNQDPLQTVFDNIVENAMRYAASYIRIYARREAENYVVVFENDGTPIPSATMDMLFEKFYKGAHGNFGLGLYITRKIALFHGGDIWCENYAQGVRFHVLLKAAVDLIPVHS